MSIKNSNEDRFVAAVNVIQSLPKNGPFQPSHQMMLTFYAYYKQAKFGPCNMKRPSFYDVVGKAKWDAWNSLGKMTQEQAMINYVEELKKIIEMMPQNSNVQEFVETLGSFYEQIIEDGKLKIPEKSEDYINKNSLNGLDDEISYTRVENEDFQSLDDVDSDSTSYLDTFDGPMEENVLPILEPYKISKKVPEPLEILINENVEIIKKILDNSLKELNAKQNALIQQMQQIKKLQLELSKSRKYDIISITFIAFSTFTTFTLLSKIMNYFRKAHIKR